MATRKQSNESFNVAFLQLHNLMGLMTKLEEWTYYHKAQVTYQQYLILIVVESNKPPVSESVIAQRLQRNLNSISMIVDRMQKTGLLDRKWSEADRRKTEVKLTRKGKSMLERALKVGAELRQQLGSGFKAEELEELTVLVTKLRNRVFTALGQEVPSPEDDQAVSEQVIRVYKRME